MPVWNYSVAKDGLAVRHERRAVLTGVSATVNLAGESRAPQCLPPGKATPHGVPFGRDLFVLPRAARSDPAVLILAASYCGDALDGARGIELCVDGVRGFSRAHASHRYSRYWTRPVWTDDLAAIPDRTQFALLERDDEAMPYLAVLPLTSHGMRAELGNCDGRLCIRSASGDDRHTPGGFLLAAVAGGADPYEAVGRAFAAGLAETGTGRLRRQKAVPPFVDWFGWCSWNAFYSNVTEADVLNALATFRKGRLPVGFYILDDGWQSGGSYLAEKNVPRERAMRKGYPAQKSREAHEASGRKDEGVHFPWGLKSFRENEKFPSGLKALIARVKGQTGLRYFGVWHTLQGIWGGIHPEGELFGQYETFQDVWGHQVFKPREAYRFFQDYHDYLVACGVDFVKVDNQAGLEGNVEQRYPVGEAARVFHQALDGSVAVHFGGQCINCMDMSTDLMLQLPVTNVARNSDDFYPWRGDNPGAHVAYNAYNNLWTGQVAIPDWDMFESHHPYGEFHAMARAVSGSPIYCTDYPGKQVFEILRRLVYADGRAVRCPEPAQVTRDCLFADVLAGEALLKVFNALPTGHGLLGVFNCRQTPGHQDTKEKRYCVFTDEQRRALRATATVSPADVEGLDDRRYAVWSHRERSLRVMGRAAKTKLTLDKLEADVLVLAPIDSGLAVLGLLDKYASAATIVDWGVEVGSGRLIAQFADGGTLGFYAERRPKAVRVDGKAVRRFDYDAGSGLLTLEAQPGAEVVVEIDPGA